MSATKMYLLSVHMVEGQEPPSEETMQTMYADVDRFNQKLQADGAWVFAGGLLPADVATVVRTQPDGKVITTDGPFAETKEHLGGFWVVRAADLDAALALAAAGSKACQGPVEVRPFQDMPEQ
ncbi:YciI family protein [Streptacidiphilus neutrinimicus]|uniref:YciI family protein n=1 Tax=Streptacidiphilus neutrinimicus TaxID=105420 RepID=UPI0005A920F1|nr:YciI family protein [Streptacidiphilus neutrinimicus]